MNKDIIIVFGKVCCGKDTFAQTLIHHTQIDIGSIVREILKDEKRQHIKELDKEIIEHLHNIFLTRPFEKFVITGIRQLSILQWIINVVKFHQLELIWLEVPDEELKRRYINRDAKKDTGMTFEEVMQRDNDLGLAELQQFVRENYAIFKTIKNYDK